MILYKPYQIPLSTSQKSHYENLPFEVPEGWVWACGNECLNPMESRKPTRETFRYIDINSIDNKKHIIFEARCMDVSHAPSRASRGINVGDTLFSMVRPYLENIAYVDEDYQDCIASTGFFVCKPKQILYSKYLYYLMLSSYVIDGLNAFMKGDNSPSINNDNITSFLFPIPPLAEQHCIVSAIESIFTLIDEIEADIQHLTQFVKRTKSKVLDLAIHGKLVPQDPNDEPASALLERIRKEQKVKKQTSGISHYPFEIPENWAWVKMKHVVNYIQRGKSPKYSPLKKYPVLAQKCNQWSGITLEKALFFEPETFGKYTKERFLHDKDVVINSTGTGTLGRIGLFDISVLGEYKCIVADSHITVVRCNQLLIIPEYAYGFLCSDYQQKVIEDNAAGSTNQKELYIDTIKEFQIPIPSLAEQKRIMKRIEAIFQTLDSIQNNL